MKPSELPISPTARLKNPFKALLLSALLTLSGTTQAKTLLSELSPILNGACSYSTNELITKVLGDVKVLCDLRDMVNSLDPLLESGSFEALGQTLASRLGANIAENSGLKSAVQDANAAFAKAKDNLQGSINDFRNLGNTLADKAVEKHKKGDQLSPDGKKLAALDGEGQAMLDKNAQVLGELIHTQTDNMERIVRSTSAAGSADDASQGAVRRSIDTSNPLGGTASKLAGELRAGLSTRDAIETVGKIELEQLKLQAVSTATLSQQLAAQTQQGAVTNELLVENFNMLMAKQLESIETAEKNYDRYAKILMNLKVDLALSASPGLNAAAALGAVK